MRIVVLLSAGSHPASGRPCRADQDARALQLALGLGGAVIGLHAGRADQPALRDYLGQGCTDLRLIPLECGHDMTAALAEVLTGIRPDLILTGMAAERGEGSGMLPYQLADMLGASILPGIAEISSLDGDRIVARQALPGGQRREIAAPCPAVLTVAGNAPDPAPIVHRRAIQGQVTELSAPGRTEPGHDQGWNYRPAAKRPKRLATGGKTAGGLGAIMSGGAAGGGTVMDRHSAEEIARALLDRLQSLNVVTSVSREK